MSWRAAGALILLIAAFALGWYSGSLSGRLTAANRSADLALKELDKVLDGQKEANKRAEKLQKTLDRLPRPTGKINEAVAAHPSRCQLDPAVVGVLQDAIRAANAARALPADP